MPRGWGKMQAMKVWVQGRMETLRADELKNRIIEDEVFLSKQNGWSRLTLVDKFLTSATRPQRIPLYLVFDIKSSRKKTARAPIGTVKRMAVAQQVVPITQFIKSSVYQVPLTRQSTSKLPLEYFFQSRRHWWWMASGSHRHILRKVSLIQKSQAELKMLQHNIFRSRHLSCSLVRN